MEFYECMMLPLPCYKEYLKWSDWRREWHPTPVFLPGESHGQRSLAGYSPWGHKESDTTEQLSKQAFSIELEQTQKLFKPDWGFKPLFFKVPVPPLMLDGEDS